MEIRLNVTRQQADEILQARLAAGAVEVDQPALLMALDHVRTEKAAAIDRQEFDEAASWRDNEKNVIYCGSRRIRAGTSRSDIT